MGERAAHQCQWGERGGTHHGAGATPPGGSGAAENGEVSPAVDRVRYVASYAYCTRSSQLLADTQIRMSKTELRISILSPYEFEVIDINSVLLLGP